jgi:hypothetical protein
LLVEDVAIPVGAVAFSWIDWLNRNPGWQLQFAWIADQWRRTGVMSRRWPGWREAYGAFTLGQPLSDAMTAFVAKMDARRDRRRNGVDDHRGRKGSRRMSTVRPRSADDLTPAELATAAIDMDRVLEREPQLGDGGFSTYERNKTSEDRAADLRRQRESTRAPRSLAQFVAARGWLRQFSKTEALNRRGTSYGLKHFAEDDIGYVTNGVFIAAAIAEGFTVRRTESGSPNAWLNISTEAWRRTDRKREVARRRAAALWAVTA